LAFIVVPSFSFIVYYQCYGVIIASNQHDIYVANVIFVLCYRKQFFAQTAFLTIFMDKTGSDYV